MGLGSLALPGFSAFGNPIDPLQALNDGMDVAQKKQLADIALTTARAKGASYADVRIGRYLNQFVVTRERRIQNIANTESFGAGIRVLANCSWGFAATNKVTKEDIVKTAEKAVAVAKANAKILSAPVQLAAQKGFGEVSWKTPIQKNAFEVPVKEKVDLLMSVNAAAMDAGASFINSILMAINEQKYFASTDGSYIDQDIHRLYPTFTVTKIDKASGKFQTRRSLSSPVGMGYEYLTPSDAGKVTGIVTRYRDRYDILEDVKNATADVDQKLKSKSVEAGKYDLVLDPSHLWLTIHESVAHPTELDRVLG
ncbi:MAG: TldD protein, partial [Chitinophagaceae bacterium]|nr:TldD protein [Chitinophagaceae bacterium]